jgi:hypothetical protein
MSISSRIFRAKEKTGEESTTLHNTGKNLPIDVKQHSRTIAFLDEFWLENEMFLFFCGEKNLIESLKTCMDIASISQAIVMSQPSEVRQ